MEGSSSEEGGLEEDRSKPDFKSVKPQPGVCGKAKTYGNENIFINLCHCPEVPSPASSFDMKKMVHCSSQELLHEMPLVIGELHVELDKEGYECNCYDVLINSDFFQELACSVTEVDYFKYLLQFACSILQTKYNITILTETVKRLNKSYYGTMPVHFIEVQSKANADLNPVHKIVPEKDDDVMAAGDSLLSSTDISASDNFAVTRQVLKTFNLKASKRMKGKTVNRESIFINLFHCPEVPPPQSSLDWNALTIMSTEECLREVPMIFGEPHSEKDERGNNYKCYDVVINSEIYHELTDSETDNDIEFVMLLASSAIELKYGININMGTLKKVILPYRGTMPAHFIKLDSEINTDIAREDKIVEEEGNVIPTNDSIFTEISSTSSDVSHYDLFETTPNLKIITPKLGKCWKSKTDKKERIYLNLCHLSEIPPPSASLDWDELILMSYEECINEIPMSLGEPHVEVNGKGKECTCYDVVINSEFYLKLSGYAKDDKIRFILLLACFALQAKYDVVFDSSTMKCIPQHYQGTMPLHVISLESKTKTTSGSFEQEDVLMTMRDSPLHMTSLSTDSSCSNLCKTPSNLVIVTPKAGGCAMCKTDKNEKIFINLCHCSEVPPPPPLLDWHKLKFRSTEENLREIPLSLAGFHVEKIETGEECKCYDVVINSKFYYELSGSVNDENLQFIILLACSALEIKYEISFDFTYFERFPIPYQGCTMAYHSISLESKAKTNSVSLDKIVPEADDWTSVNDSSLISSSSDVSFHNHLELPHSKVTPKAGKCAMCKTDRNEEIFVNLCHCSEIPPPLPSLDWGKLIFMSTEECMREIPMSLGVPHIEIDSRKNDECKCYDVVISTEFYYKISGSVIDEKLQFIMLLACSAVELKYDFAIDFETLEIQLIPYQGAMMVLHNIRLQSKTKTNLISLDKIVPQEDDVLMPVTTNLIPSLPLNVSSSGLFEARPNVKAIIPKPGLCVKAKADNSEKIFINLCHHSDVPAPPPSVNVEDIINSSEESLFHFPLSLGDLHVEMDKNGNACKCYDVVINSEYYQQVSKKASLQDFILVLASSGLERKYDIAIDVGTFKLLNKSYHGTIPEHFIRLQSKMYAELPVFDECVAEDDILMPLKDSSRLIPFPALNITDYNLFRKSLSHTLLIFQGFCTGFPDRRSLVVLVSKHKITIEDTKGKKLLIVPLPYVVFPEKSLANLYNNRVTVAMPVVSSDL